MVVRYRVQRIAIGLETLNELAIFISIYRVYLRKRRLARPIPADLPLRSRACGQCASAAARRKLPGGGAARASGTTVSL